MSVVHKERLYEEGDKDFMPIVTIIATKEASIEAIESKIEELYQDNYSVSGRGVWFIRTDELTARVAEKLGMNDEHKHTGIVVKNDAWYGYADLSLWEWGKKGE